MAENEIEIDGRKLTIKPDQTIIQVADDAGIYIPRFCYHKHLSIPANCRMCLVEVEKAPKTLPACATPATPGMRVFTKSEKSILSQRAVMEYLLINHPLDCPICDQGGECELQDLSMGYGKSASRYTESKRAVADQDLGPLISTEMTRCIYCTRCVRFEEEVAGLRELGAIGRGEFTEIGTYIQHAIRSEVSGNIIDLCPVGALTSKPFRFRARVWELDQAPSVSPHDCVGSNLNMHTRYGTVMRVVARENLAINETWLADRDRYSYTGLYHADRLEEPMVRITGKWETVSWQKAFEKVAQTLQDTVSQQGPQQLGGLASPNATVEEFYLFQKIIRGLGSPHVDYRLREIDNSDDATIDKLLCSRISMTELQQCDVVLLIGSNLQKEQPIAGLRVRKAALNAVPILAVNPVDYRFNFKITAKKIIAPHLMPNALAAIVNTFSEGKKEFPDIESDDEAKAIAHQLSGKKNALILLGALAMHHPQAANIRYLAQRIADVSGAKLAIMKDGANAAGGFLAGATPYRDIGGMTIKERGLSAYDMLAKPRQAYLLLNIEPDLDCANASLAVAALKQAKFVACLSQYRNPVLEAHADVLLPMAAFTETSGTFVNSEGNWQSFTSVAKPVGESRPAWKILRVLGNFLDLKGFDYASSEAVRDEVKSLAEKTSVMPSELSRPANFSLSKDKGFSRIGEIPIYATDSLVRRAGPLQEAQTMMEGEVSFVHIHPNTAQKLHLQENDFARIKQPGAEGVQLQVVIDNRIPQEAAWVAGGIAATSSLGDLFGEIELEKVE